MVIDDPAALPPKSVGATAVPLDLTPEGATTSLSLDPTAARELAAALAAEDEPPHGTALLRLDGIVGDRPANLAVFLEGAGASSHRIGVIGLYGLAQASKPDRHGEGGEGMAFSLEISAALARLWRTTPLGPSGLRLRLVPTRPLPPGAHLRIARIDLLHIHPRARP